MTENARRRGFCLPALAALLVFGSAVSVGASVLGPRETMQDTIDQVLAVLNDKSLDFDRRLETLEKIAFARFDMQTMSRLVLARSWNTFSAAQRDEYIAQFKKYLANNYGTRINRYDNETVEVLEVRDEARGDVTVRTRIVGGEFEDARVDYRMRKSDGAWLVIDVTIEGISMVSNFRDQFREVLSQGGPDHLIAKLKEKNALGLVDEE
jgi:phospholipid transport system substrate-binding protein